MYSWKYDVSLPGRERGNRFSDYENKVKAILHGLPSYEEAVPEEIKIAAEPDLSTPLPEKKIAAGFGYHGGNIPCSRSIIDDTTRLEVLIGAKRAGNNSPEIINEATEICQRLFRGRVMDIGMYRSFVNELIDDYYSD